MLITWSELSKVLATKKNVLLFGAPGFGKTFQATADKGCYNVTVTEETAAAELRGHYIPQGQSFQWHNGPALLAWMHGARLVINEIDRASGDALTFFYALLDDPRMASMTLPSGETVRPAEGFHSVATTNATLDQLRDLPSGLLDRFAIRICIDELHPDALASLSADLRSACTESVSREDDEQKISFRQWKAFDGLRIAGLPADVAAKAVFLHRSEDVLNSLKLAAVKPVAVRK